MSIEDQRSKINEFLHHFREGVEAWKKAGTILVDLVESDPHVYDYITRECPSMTPGILDTFERIGRGQILPTLAMDSSPGVTRLKRLPISAQSRYETEPVPLIVETDDGPDVLLVKVRDMTKSQAAQVFGPGRLRSEGEQRAYLMERRSNAAKPVNKVEKPWKIVGGKLNVQGVVFTAGDLASILTQMTK